MTVPQHHRSYCRTPANQNVSLDRAADAAAELGPLKVADRAKGEPHESLPNVTKIRLVDGDGAFALIDSEDYELVKRYRWRKSKNGYAAITAYHEGKRQTLLMHRVVMMLGPLTYTDHKNREKLDNRKSNLRICTPAENSHNSSFAVNNTSGVKGVHGMRGQWCARVNCHGIPYTRMFKELLEAKEWIEGVRAVLHGEFACNGGKDST